MIQKRYLTVFLFCLCLAPSLNGHPKTISDSSLITAIWEKEVEYWNAVETGNVAAYIQLYHPKHLSWPSFTSAPEDRNAIEKRLHGFIENIIPGSIAYELTSFTVKDENDLAFAYYLANWKMKTQDGTEMQFSEKFLHIWKKEKDDLMLIGGMSGLIR